MEFKVVVSDPKTGKSIQVDVKDDKAKALSGKQIGDEVDGSFVGLTGYKLKIMGGSDKAGFPMKKGVHGTARPMVLLSGGVGYNPKRAERRRKRLRGEKIDADIVQVNTKIVSAGKKTVEELLGLTVEEKKEETSTEKTAKAPAEKKEEKSDSKKEDSKKAVKEKPASPPKEKESKED